MSIILAILVFSFLVITHELGHFLFAKRSGIGVTEFSVGMGPRLFSFVRGETQYSLKAIPFGGSCMMVGEDEDSEAENAFNKKSVWARILVVAGGPLFNFLSAFLLSLIMIACVGVNPAKVYTVYQGYGAEQTGIREGDEIRSINGTKIHVGRDIELYLLMTPLDGSDVTVVYRRDGEDHTVTYDPHYETYRLGISYFADENEAVLSEIQEGTPAADAGLAAGDIITSIDGTPITVGNDIQQYFAENPPDGSLIEVGYVRDGTEYTTDVEPAFYESNILGFQASYYREKKGPVSVVAGSVQELVYWIRYTVSSLRMLVTGKVSAREMSGPVGIVSTISTAVETSKSDGALYVFLNIVQMAVLLSVNLGVLNLLPIPALDGGRLIFLLIEAVRGKPVPPEKEGMVHTVGFILLMVLMVFVLFNDVSKLIGIG